MNQISKISHADELRIRGFKHIHSFFPEEMKADLLRRAQEVLDLREAGKLTVASQDSMGLSDLWFSDLLTHPALIELVTSALGPNVCMKGCRILAKDKHFKMGVHVHQDWPYNPGDTKKVSVFIPLTKMNAANGGLIFIEGSHHYGPVSKGSIDLSRFPPMPEETPDADVGDLIICDFLTWHYSNPSQNGEPRIMLQLNYQPADDASSDNVVAGVRSHDKVLMSRFDAVSVPSVELNAAVARKYFQSGDFDHATRYAKGLLLDDQDHAGAALLLCDILSSQKDPKALPYLEMARAAVKKFQAQISAYDQKFGLPPESWGGDAALAEVEAVSPWRPLPLTLFSSTEGYGNAMAFPAVLGTPADAWSYGAASDALNTPVPAAIRVRAKALRGKIGFCLSSEDWSALVSEQFSITPDAGETTVMIPFTPASGPARLVVRNFDDGGQAGEVEITSIDIMQYT